MPFFCKLPSASCRERQPVQSGPIPPGGYDLAALLLLGLLVGVVYGQVGGHQFVAWDDPSYVSENRRVLQGLHWDNVVWAFSTFQLSNWHPLTLISHMADVSLWGVHPGQHALVNVGLHGASALLIYALMRRIDFTSGAGDSGRLTALLVAALFAVHPLHVESVAWISERKDVLCAFFWLLAMHAYVSYARRQTAIAYAAVTLCVALALLAKPMAISLPLVFLILDGWPLRRIDGLNPWRAGALLLEKSPWLLLAAAVGVLTLNAQTQAMPAFAVLERVQVAITAYGWYLEKTVWPAGLHFYYLTEAAWDPLRLALSAVALLAISALVVRERTRHPDWLAGWLWFLITLLPVVGFVKVGTQAWADRYAYLPHIGLFWMLISMVASLLYDRRRKVAAAAFAAVVVLASTVAAHRQVTVWRDASTLYRHALAQNHEHYVATMGLAQLALRRNDYPEAALLARRALSLSSGPSLVRAMQAVLGDVALVSGDPAGAIGHYSQGVAADPANDSIRLKLGFALMRSQRLVEAEFALREAVRLAVDPVEALNGLGVVLGLRGALAESYVVLQRGIALAPTHRSLRHNLATTALRGGDVDTARRTYQDLMNHFPDDAVARQALAGLAGSAR